MLHFVLIYPLVICYIAIEICPVEIVDLPSYKIVDLSSSLCKRLPGRVSSQKSLKKSPSSVTENPNISNHPIHIPLITIKFH